MEITKEIVKYTLYKRDDVKARVYDNGKIVIVHKYFTKNYKKLSDHDKEILKPLIDFIEKDLGHNFTIAENEIDD
jgi:hypothetical protein